MEQEEFLKQLELNYKKGLTLLSAKNHDYAKGDDPFSNFRMSQLVGIPVEQAILMRVCDKLARVSNLWNKTAKVTEEQIEDTLLDACNYLNILLVYRLSQEKDKE